MTGIRPGFLGLIDFGENHTGILEIELIFGRLLGLRRICQLIGVASNEASNKS